MGNVLRAGSSSNRRGPWRRTVCGALIGCLLGAATLASRASTPFDSALYSPASTPSFDQDAPVSSFARGRRGMVATGSAFATRAGVRMLEAGGNAVDAAAAAYLALTVTDPANTSLGGRAQILVRLAEGRVVAIDGATEAPASVTALARPNELREGYAVVPAPGGLAAVAQMVTTYGRLKFAEAITPAIALAEDGFAVPPRLAAGWTRMRDALARDPGTARTFLKPDRSAYQAGELFRQPSLARVLRHIARDGVEVFYRGVIADAIARDVAIHGGFLSAKDLAAYRVLPGVVVETTYRGAEVAAAGGRAWGDTLVQMLNMLGQFAIAAGEPTATEVELLARVMAQALADRPQEIGSLKPKAGGHPLATLSSRAFALERAARIKEQLTARPRSPERVNDAGEAHERDGDTTHLSVMDADGNAVSLTTSIGPSFGARVTTPDLGFLYALSYRMRADPTPNARDETEMTPAIVVRRGQPVLVIGAAGSERIPTSMLQVISLVLDRGRGLEQAMSAPRIFALADRLRLHDGLPAGMADALAGRGFVVESVDRGAAQHLGIVHAVSFDPRTREFTGAADPEGDGTAAGPAKVPR
ncbi:MAG: gamma-glutamyltransferase family protein [Acidobacteriota bacterium]